MTVSENDSEPDQVSENEKLATHVSGIIERILKTSPEDLGYLSTGPSWQIEDSENNRPVSFCASAVSENKFHLGFTNGLSVDLTPEQYAFFRAVTQNQETKDWRVS